MANDPGHSLSTNRKAPTLCPMTRRLVTEPTNRQDPDMTKLIAALMAALFAVATVAPTFAAEEKKDAKKEQKKDEKKDEKKADKK